jgi:hypothetical protein
MRGSTTRQVTFLSVTTDQLIAADDGDQLKLTRLDQRN